ncbi:MAG TPA: TraB/GumN family protein [Allosphingosinicella sp.]|uniref:TraB/GumN family protein n=1 Tax=Allosphingosinicella sp. TaxID=2823234 RepID=UPI002EDABB74
MKKFLLGALLAAVSAPAMAQAPLPDADPAMWVVKDEDTTVYLFGTFHLLDGKQDWFNDEVKAAFDKSEEVVLEALIPDDPAELQPLVVKYAVDSTGRTLSSKLPPDVKTKFDAELKTAGIPGEALDPMEPWFAAMTLTSVAAMKLGLKPEHGPETILKKAATDRKLALGELEGTEFQLSLFDKMPEAQQIKFLGQTLDSMSKIDETLTPMLTAWAKGDTDGLVKIMNDGLAEDPELYDLLFTQRNAEWAEWIDNRLDKPGTVFVAVGAGHLAGKGSVQDMLQKRGIKSARVTQ